MTVSYDVNLLQKWSIEFFSADVLVEIKGSPDRIAARAVVSDASGDRWGVEQIDPDNLDRKKEQLVAFTNSGLERIHSWRSTTKNPFFQCLEKSARLYCRCLQCSQFTFQSDLNVSLHGLYCLRGVDADDCFCQSGMILMNL